MIEFIGKPFWFLLPAGFANMAPIFAAKLFPLLNRPIDFGRTFRKRSIFGSHKSIMGIISGVIVATIVFLIQSYIYRIFPMIKKISIIDYDSTSFILGSWMGLAALTGDLIKSFVKRRLDIAPGRPWLPWDKIDWIIGVLAATYMIVSFTFGFVLSCLVLGFLLSLAARAAGYFLHINKDIV